MTNGGDTVDFWDVLEGRRSIRDFEPTEVPSEVLERIVRAAGMAPSAMNSQPWNFHVCQGTTRAQVGETLAQATVHLLEYMEMLGPERYESAVKWYSSLGDAPVVVIVSMPKPDNDFDTLNRMLSVGCATENLVLAAKAEGLGACPVTFGWWVRDEMRDVIGLSSDETIATIIALGYPGDVPPAAPPRREDITVWHT